jgi:hypothetical protein
MHRPQDNPTQKKIKGKGVYITIKQVRIYEKTRMRGGG